MTVGHLKQLLFYLQEDFLSKDDFQVLQIDGKPLVEKNFALPYYSDDDIEVILCGTMDKIGKVKNSNYAVGDYKFTSVWNSVEYLASYALSPQLLFYTLALKLYAKIAPDSDIGKIGLTPVSAFIDGVFLGPDAKKVKLERSELFTFKQKQLDEFERLMMSKIMELKEEAIRLEADVTYEIPRYGMFNGACQTHYGLCKYFRVCSAPDKISRDMMLEKFFTKKEYNPLNFNS
jgi:hypothetical protein